MFFQPSKRRKFKIGQQHFAIIGKLAFLQMHVGSSLKTPFKWRFLRVSTSLDNPLVCDS